MSNEFDVLRDRAVVEASCEGLLILLERQQLLPSDMANIPYSELPANDKARLRAVIKGLGLG